jgi:bis(5'-nucleosyl)-tetraphosphatase (symmetrical)
LAEPPVPEGRLSQRIFIGDVQGCAEELDALLDRVRAELGGDFELLFVGDLVNRGPASFRVLERVRALESAGRARLVLGNHDLWLITLACGVGKPRALDTLSDVLERPDAADWIDWLRRQPFLIDGALGDSPFALVHAALAPAWSLAQARALAGDIAARVGDANRAAARAFVREAHRARKAARERTSLLDALGRLVSARSALPDGGWSEALPQQVEGGEPWHAAWARAGHAFGVVYGHWALQKLHVAPRLRGLDTGCVHHDHGGDGFLTAWLPDETAADPFALPDERFLQVRAKRRYWT